MQSIVGNFPWQRPPWQGGTTKYRLGMRPVSVEHWFQGRPPPDLRVHKYSLLKRRYGQVVQALPEAANAQAILAEQMHSHGWYDEASGDATNTQTSSQHFHCRYQTIFASCRLVANND